MDSFNDETFGEGAVGMVFVKLFELLLLLSFLAYAVAGV